MPDLKSVAITVTVLLMFMNATPALLINSGVAEDMGIQPSVSGDNTIDAANEDLRSVNPSGGLAPTLFQLYASVTSPVRSVMDIIVGGPIMLMSAGVPGWLVDFIFVPQYLLMGGTIIYVLAGRRL